MIKKIIWFLILFLVIWPVPQAHAVVSCLWQATGARAAGNGNVTVSWPAHQTDDIGLLFLESANEPYTLTAANGFVEVANSPQGTGTAGDVGATLLSVYWARATSGSMSGPQTGDPGNHSHGIIITFRGCETSGSPIDVTNGEIDATSDTSGSIAGNTTTDNDRLVVIGFAKDTDSNSASQFGNWTNASLANLTERSDGGTTFGNGGGIGVVVGEFASQGTFNTTTVTYNVASVKGQIAVVLKSPGAATCAPGINHPLLGVGGCP
jgi:hypothetical protein